MCSSDLNVLWQSATPLAFPLCWPVAVCCAPCICTLNDALERLHGGTLYALTENGFWRWVDADPHDADCLGCPLLDARMYESGMLPLEMITSIATDIEPDMKTSFDSCCPTSQVVLTVATGHRLAKYAAGVLNLQCYRVRSND